MNRFIIAPLALILSTPVLAGEPSPWVDARQHRQAVRIGHQAAHGHLTRSETRVLIAEQRRIHALERRFEADGRLGPVERRVLDARQDAASRHIWRQAHDGQNRP